MKAEVEIELKTARASSQLRKLSSEASASGRKMSSQVREGFFGGALGGAVGSAIAQARSQATGSASAGIGDLFSEQFGGWWEQAKDWAFDGLDIKSKAQKSAREEAEAIFGYSASFTGNNAAITSWINQSAAIKERAFQGAREIRMADENRENVFSKLLDKLIQAIQSMFNALYERIESFFTISSSGK